MKLIIAGSRNLFANMIEIQGLLDRYKLTPTEIVSGTARGIDKCGEDYARYTNLKLSKFPAEWELHGKATGHIRNSQMAEYANSLLLIWDGQSRGSANMRDQMLRLGKKVFEAIVDDKSWQTSTR